MQLPPVDHNYAAAFAGLHLSLFERSFNLPGQAAITLTEQHRMHPSISAWPSQYFYQGLLINAAAVREYDSVASSPWIGDARIAFVHVEGPEQTVGKGYSSADEADMAAKIVQGMLCAGSVGAENIGVITPYDAQRAMIKTRMTSGVEVASVDSFQGREKEVMVLSLVRFNGRRAIGFCSNRKRPKWHSLVPSGGLSYLALFTR